MTPGHDRSGSLLVNSMYKNYSGILSWSITDMSDISGAEIESIMTKN